MFADMERLSVTVSRIAARLKAAHRANSENGAEIAAGNKKAIASPRPPQSGVNTEATAEWPAEHSDAGGKGGRRSGESAPADAVTEMGGSAGDSTIGITNARVAPIERARAGGVLRRAPQCTEVHHRPTISRGSGTCLQISRFRTRLISRRETLWSSATSWSFR